MRMPPDNLKGPAFVVRSKTSRRTLAAYVCRNGKKIGSIPSGTMAMNEGRKCAEVVTNANPRGCLRRLDHACSGANP